MTSFIWIGFILGVLGLLALDLGVFHRASRVISIREALAWTLFWVVLALVFNVGVYFLYRDHLLGIGLHVGHELSGQQAALQFFTGYLIEKSLSLDNIFVIALIFTYFGIPAAYQHRVLFWGILGALVMRGAMIAAGAALIQRFDWVVYVFGGLLIATAIKMLVVRHDNIAPERNWLVRLARRLYPVSESLHGDHFFARLPTGQRAMTPMFLVLLIVESTDVLFAVDSIPAIFAVTRDPFLVFTSNVFAILGLRSLYFALAGMMHQFQYLKASLVFVLAFVGVKMILSHHHPIPTAVSLAVIVGIIAVGVLASIWNSRSDPAPLVSPLAGELGALAQLTWRQARRIATIVIGSTVLLIGVAMLVLPGPAVVVIPIGLAILGTELLWARRLLKRFKRQGAQLVQGLGFGGSGKPGDRSGASSAHADSPEGASPRNSPQA